MRYLMVVCCFAAAVPAVADVKLVYQDETGAPAYTISVQGDRMRIDMHDEESHATLFNATKEEMIILQPNKREYLVMDRASVEHIQKQMRQVMQMMEQYGMDPAAMGLDKQRVAGEVVASGESRTVGGHRCEVYRYVVDGEVDTVSCVAAPGRVGISDGDWATIRRMYGMMSQLATDMLPEGMMGDLPPMDGVIIESHDADGSNRELLSQVDSARLDRALFEVPSGWKRTALEMPDMPGMPGGL